jgi:putative membrane protein
MNFIVKVILSTIAVILAAYLLPKSMVTVDGGFLTALIVALVLAFLNAVVRPLMIILTIPATVVTFGLFLLVINAVIVLIADYFVDGFKVHGFWSALVFSIILTIINSILEAWRKRDEQRQHQQQ